jgi:hypothetical protein
LAPVLVSTWLAHPETTDFARRKQYLSLAACIEAMEQSGTWVGMIQIPDSPTQDPRCGWGHNPDLDDTQEGNCRSVFLN